jgi:hypothetical protein
VTYFITVFSVTLVLAAQLSAQSWVRGALYLHAVEGEITLSELGGEPSVLGAAQAPVAASGLATCSGEYGSSAFFSTSNRSHIYFEGTGSFAVERLEQIAPDQAVWEAEPQEAGQSRMIINFRAGTIISDNRNMIESSQCLVETPLGRLTVKRALWQMNIVFDPRSQIFDFRIICSSGRVRFTDLQGQHYTLRTGQRLVGAGSRMTPSIEVGEATDDSREQMERYHDLANIYVDAGDELALYLKRLQPIKKVVQSLSQDVVSTESTRRPIVIEHASEPNPVTPFRGELAPPSEWQADFF